MNASPFDRELSQLRQAADIDPQETQEWLDALCAATAVGGSERGLFLLQQLEEQARQLGIVAHMPPYSACRNTIPLENQGAYPGDLALEEKSSRCCAGTRWPW